VTAELTTDPAQARLLRRSDTSRDGCSTPPLVVTDLASNTQLPRATLKARLAAVLSPCKPPLALAAPPSSVAAGAVQPPELTEADAFRVICGTLQHALDALGPVIAAVLVLAARLLAGANLVHSALTVAFLWLVLLLSESHAVSQSTLALLVYASAFTLPAAYRRSAEGVDAAVLQLAAAGHTVFVLADRRLVGVAAVAAAAVFWGLETSSLVLRATAACVVLTGVLMWHARAIARACHVTPGLARAGVAAARG